MVIKLRRALLKFSYPLLKQIGKWHAPWTHKFVCSANVREAMSKLEIGDIMLTMSLGEATNLIIPGLWKHAAIYVGNGVVVEAKDPQVVCNDIYDFMMTKDFVVIMRPLLSQIERARAAQFAVTLVGKPYDYDFELDVRTAINPAFYCAEVPYWCYAKTVSDWDFKLRDILGVPTVKPDDYFLADRYFFIVWTNAHDA